MDNKDYTILIVDDKPENLKILGNLLNEYNIKIAVNGQKALDIIYKNKIDLILLDVMMPELDGYQTCKILKDNKNTKDIPVIFLTARTSIKDEEFGLSIGAIDFLTKPISPTIVKSRVKIHLENREYQKILENRSISLENEVNKKIRKINEMQDGIMTIIISLAEFRDENTGNHINRTKRFVELLATKLAKKEKYKDLLSLNYIEVLVKSAPLHDIGKIAIPDNILLKQGKLTEEEFEIMKTHTTKGVEILRKAKNYIDENNDFLLVGMEIAGGHHEKWNGTGYPKGLKGEEIPLSARLMALADVYDALTTERAYKKAFSHEKATMMIEKANGTHFDPEIVEVFLNTLEEFRKIALKWSDKN